MKPTQGYLVVLTQLGTQFGPGINPRYRGICRIPTWPSAFAAENSALERYVLELRNEDGFIDNLAVARGLLLDLRDSPREFEIINCVQVSSAFPQVAAKHPLLGYDIIPIRADYLSRVGCFPADLRVKKYRSMLNRFGLFNDSADAFAYLSDYVANRLPEWKVPAGIFQVALVEL